MDPPEFSLQTLRSITPDPAARAQPMSSTVITRHVMHDLSVSLLVCEYVRDRAVGTGSCGSDERKFLLHTESSQKLESCHCVF